MKYNKLVRDDIPKIIRSRGGDPKYHIATDSEYWDKLVEKLREEIFEFYSSRSEEELADVWEVMEAIVEDLARKIGSDIGRVREARIKKNKERGSFKGRVVLEEA